VQAPQDRKPPGSQRIQPRREPKRVPTRTAPHARPTTPPAGKSTRRPTRGATFGASANSTHLARHTRYTATGSAFTLVIPHRKAPCPMPATPGKEPPGVATRMPLAQKDNRRAALYSLPDPPPHDSAQQDKLPPCCPPRGAMSSATPQETTCPAPPTPRKETRGVGARMPFAQKDNSMLAVACHPFTWTKSRQGERVTIHTRNRPG
jgi:hypothetical protein